MTSAKSPSLGRRLLDGWMVIAGRFGSIQTLLIVTLSYLLVIGPFAIAISLGRGDLLAKRGLKSLETAWRDADTAKPDLERAKLLS